MRHTSPFHLFPFSTILAFGAERHSRAWLKKLTEMHEKAKEKKAAAALPPVVITSEKHRTS